MTGFVLDASVTIAWLFPDESAPYANAVMATLSSVGATVPAIWSIEIANVLVVGERHGRISRADSDRFASLLSELPITPDDAGNSRGIASVMSVARNCKLSAYDASYLELALRLGLPIATLDSKLRAAATALGVFVLQPPAGTSNL